MPTSRATYEDGAGSSRRQSDNYAEAAEGALGAGDIGGALEQVAAALALRPDDSRLLGLCDRIVADAGDPLRFALAEGDVFWGLAAVRARIFAGLGRLDDALDYLFAATLAEPSAAFLPWAVAWVEAPEDAGRVDAPRLARHLSALLDALPDGLAMGQGLAANLGAAADVAARVGEARGSPPLVALASQLLRAAGRDREALERLEEATSKAPTWETLAATGALYRARGDFSRAATAFERAAAARPAEPSTYVDWGDALVESGRYAEARGAYEAALARDPSNAWAVASRAFVVASDEADGLAADALARFAGRDGPRSRAAALLRQFRAYESELPPPLDPFSHVVRGLLAGAASAPAAKPVRVVVRSRRPEPPSVHVALALGLARFGRAGQLVVECEGRLETMTPRGPLWRSEGARLVPALPAPPPVVTRAVAALACEPFDRARWQQRARHAASMLGAGEDVFAASMVHPPPPPNGEDDVVTWVARTQVAAAMLLAGGEGAWERSLRRSVLMGIVGGPDDGTVAAACVALCGVAEGDSAARPEVEAALERLAQAASCEEPPTFALAVAWALLRLGVGDEERCVHLRSLAHAALRRR